MDFEKKAREASTYARILNRNAASEHIRAVIEQKHDKGAHTDFEKNAGSKHTRADIEEKRGK